MNEKGGYILTSLILSRITSLTLSLLSLFLKSKPLTTDEALSKLEYFCAYQERCPKEVRTKLAALGVRGESADQIFEVLQNDGYINEERFAMAYAGGKFRINHWGRVRIRMELRMRDIAADLIEKAIDSIDETAYTDQLQQLLEKKQAHYEGQERARDKTAAALIRAGFEMELVFKFLNQR